VAGRGPLGLRLRAARQHGDALPRGGASLLAKADQGRGEKREGGREKRVGFKLNFLKILNRNLKKI
jgi:hypothetical protein